MPKSTKRRKKLSLDERKAHVRVYVTYWATAFIFGGGVALMLTLLFLNLHDEVLQVFNSLLPVASGIIAFWFGARGRSSKSGGAHLKGQEDAAKIDSEENNSSG